MYRNFMVMKIKSKKQLNKVIDVLRSNRIHYYLDDNVIRVNVGSTRKSTKRFDICKELGFKWEESV